MIDGHLLGDVPSVSATEAQALVEKGALLVDIREVDEHAAVRIPDARLLPMSSINAWWRELPDDRPVVLYCRTGNRSHQATAALTTQGGMSNVHNLVGGIIEWYEQGLPIDTSHVDVPAFQAPYGEMDAPTAGAALEGGGLRWVLDVREGWEWDAGHLAGSVHIPLRQLTYRADELPRREAVLVVCNTGQRSALAAQYLCDAGFDAVHNLEGGLEAWRYHGFPLAAD